MRALLGLLLATAACSHTTPTGARAERRWNASCQVRRGCPQAAVPPACPAELVPLTVDEALARGHELDGEPVAVRGPLQQVCGNCTLLACYSAESVETRAGGLSWRYRAPEPGKPRAMATLDDETFAGDRVLYREGGCCNSCGAGLALGGIVWLEGPQLACRGDESQMCCGVEPRGQDVIARGILRHGASAPTLEGAALCTLPGR
jgi:hypothetical protein